MHFQREVVVNCQVSQVSSIAYHYQVGSTPKSATSFWANKSYAKDKVPPMWKNSVVSKSFPGSKKEKAWRHFHDLRYMSTNNETDKSPRIVAPTINLKYSRNLNI